MGYRPDYKGLGVFLYRSVAKGKWVSCLKQFDLCSYSTSSIYKTKDLGLFHTIGTWIITSNLIILVSSTFKREIEVALESRFCLTTFMFSRRKVEMSGMRSVPYSRLEIHSFITLLSFQTIWKMIDLSQTLMLILLLSKIGITDIIKIQIGSLQRRLNSQLPRLIFRDWRMVLTTLKI